MGPDDEEPKHPGAPNTAELVSDGGPQVGGGAGDDGDAGGGNGAGETGRWRTSLLVPAIIIAVTVGIIIGIVLISQQEQGDGRSALVEASVDTSDLPVTVPYRDVAGYIVLDVTLGDGSRTVPMILDSGAPTIISEALAEVFAGGEAGSIATTSADGQVISSSVVTLPTVSIGGVSFRDVGAVVGAIEPGNPFSCITDAGFIGTSLLQAAVWQIDPVAGEITIAASADGLEHIDGAERIEFIRASEVSASPVIEARAGTQVLSLLVDTGSDGWITVNPRDINDEQLPADAPSRSVLVSGANGSFLTSVRWTKSELDLGGGPATLPVATADVLPERQGNIGTDYLAGHVVTIDWTEDVVYLDPIADEHAPTPPMSASLGWNDGYVLGAFVEGLPGADVLTLGAPVVAIDGRDVSDVPFDDFCSHLTGPRTGFEMTVDAEVPTTLQVAEVADFYEPLAD
jgi:predicted aspartyl protease